MNRLILCVTGILLSGAASAQQNVQFEPSPVSSLSGTMQFLESVELRVLSVMGYVAREDLEASTFVGGRSGVETVRVYVRSDRGRERRVEIAIVKGLAGGYDLAFGQGAGSGEPSSLPGSTVGGRPTMGMSPGPMVGGALRELTSAKLDGLVSNEEGERALVNQIISRGS